jgi:hypothetical protein
MQRSVRRLVPIALLATALGASSAWLNAAPAAQTSAAAVPALTVGAERPVTAGLRPGNTQFEPSVAFSGNVFYVVWSEASTAGGPTQIYGARVSKSGTVLDPGGVQLSTTSSEHAHPRVAGGNGRFLVVWEEQPEGTFTDLGAALVNGSGAVLKQWGINRTDNDQFRPHVAWNGQLFMVTWVDHPDVEEGDIYAARVTSNGLTLDGCSSDGCINGDNPGISLGNGPGNQLQPAIAGAPDFFVVIWQEQATATPDLHAGRIALNADLFDPTSFNVSSSPGTQGDPALARNGAAMLVAWVDDRSGTSSDIFSTRIKPTNNVFTPPPAPLPPNGRVVSNGTGDQTQPTVVRRGDGWVVVWTDDRSGTDDVRASRVARDGTVLDAAGVTVAGTVRDENFAAAADGGSAQLVAYERDVTAPPSNGVDRVFFRLLT